MKGFFATCSIAAVVLFPLALKAAGSAALSIKATGATGTSYGVGQNWTLDLTSSFPGANFLLCTVDNYGNQSCTPWAVTNGNGSWTGAGVFGASTAGQWTEWVSFPSQNVTSNRITFTVNSGNNGSTSAAPGTLNITLDPNIPGQSPLVTPGSTGDTFALADLTAESAPITVNNLNWDCGGYACNSVTNLKMIGAGPDDGAWYGSPSNEYAFAPNLVIPAGASEYVELVGNVAANAPIGQQIQWSLSPDLVDITGASSITGGGFMNVFMVVGSSSTTSLPATPSPQPATEECSTVLQSLIQDVATITIHVNAIIASNVASPSSASPSLIASLTSAMQNMVQSLQDLLLAEGCGGSAG